MKNCFSQRSFLTRLAVVAAAVVLFCAQNAQAALILTFSQAATDNQLTATQSGGIQTTLSATGVAVIGGYAGGGGDLTPFSGYLNLQATSNDAAVNPDLVGDVLQHFGGAFQITANADGTGTNYLSGIFSDALFGSGSGLVLTASEPDDIVQFTSSVLTVPGQLDPSRAISLALTNVTPQVHITGSTIDDFTSSVGGNFSSENQRIPPIPEPASLAIWGIGMGLAMAGFRRKKTVVS